MLALRIGRGKSQLRRAAATETHELGEVYLEMAFMAQIIEVSVPAYLVGHHGTRLFAVGTEILIAAFRRDVYRGLARISGLSSFLAGVWILCRHFGKWDLRMIVVEYRMYGPYDLAQYLPPVRKVECCTEGAVLRSLRS